MTIKEAIKTNISKKCKRASAIRARQAPAKLDRSRWEGCDYCENQKIGEVMITNRRKYCSICGRPITEEAWAELERRIGGGQD